MNEQTATAPKQPPKKPSGLDDRGPAKSALEDGALRVKRLTFRGVGVDLPNEQQQMRISEVMRAGKPQYRIWFVPRLDKYLVREYMADKPCETPMCTFLVPGDWALAEFAE
jgi:hypothetical protein